MSVAVTETGSSSETRTASDTETTAPRVASSTASVSGVNVEQAAADALRAQADADASFIRGQFAEKWVPQLSSKQVGMVADGVTWTNADILREHLQLRMKYPDVRLTWSGDWSSYSRPDFWVTTAGVTFPDSGDALSWCSSKGFDRDHCYAHIVSNSRGPEGTTAFQP